MGDAQTAVAVGVPVIGFIVWLVRLEGRINTGEIVTKGIKDDVSYIRERIDRALNGRHD